ncbi:MAG TPA: sigma-70 family RNA polymerase sigma factor [Polyangium sp.]|jgi:RNA polymerase sigma factor (sigma-70 family)|nr:sigma-70 family RNA polymerase sigma factor [Polyangium sp.]
MALLAQPKSENQVLGLLERALRGDPAAERRLSETLLLPTIEAAVSKYLFGRAKLFFEKEDLIHEIFAHLYSNGWEKLRHYEPQRGTLEAFVFEVARSWIRDHSRRNPPPTPEADLDEHVVPDSGPEAALRLSRTVAAVLAVLDEDEVLLFRWLYLENIDRVEIAARIQLSMEATYKRIQRMEAKVKKALSNPEAKATTTSTAAMHSPGVGRGAKSAEGDSKPHMFNEDKA